MTLQKQLLITIFGLFVCLFIGTLSISSYLTRTYLDKQLTTHAQDAATSLGLLLSPLAQTNDKATMVSIVDSVFDRGYYDSIRLFDVEGKLIINRKTNNKVYNVPGWFVALMALDPPRREAELINGWQQAGKVSVQSHPGYAYQELWTTSIAVLVWFFVLSLALFALGVYFIHRLLKPLRAIGLQAKAISQGHFPLQKTLPKTTQLRAVTVAMNKMTTKLKALFYEQSEITESLRRQVYHDSLTELYNRTFFENHLLHNVTLSEDEINGVIFLVQLDGLQQYSEINGILTTDTLLRHIAAKLEKITSGLVETICCRLTGASFAVVSLHLSAEKIQHLSTLMKEALFDVAKEHGEEDILTPYVAVIHLEKGKTVDEILSDADVAMRTAHESKDHVFDDHQPSPAEQITDNEWKKILNYILKKDKIILFTQTIFSKDKQKKLFSEVLMRAQDKDNHLRSGRILFPMAQRLQMSADFDKAVLLKTISYLKDSGATHQNYCVNLTVAFLQDEENLNWLQQQLSSLADMARHIIIEISEEIIVKHQDIIDQLSVILTGCGAKIGVDQFGRALSSFAYLLGKSIAYVKIDGSFIRNIDSNQENQTYIQSLVRVAHSIDIMVIADKVENVREFSTCSHLNIDAMQGMFLEVPQEMTK